MLEESKYLGWAHLDSKWLKEARNAEISLQGVTFGRSELLEIFRLVPNVGSTSPSCVSKRANGCNEPACGRHPGRCNGRVGPKRCILQRETQTRTPERTRTSREAWSAAVVIHHRRRPCSAHAFTGKASVQSLGLTHSDHRVRVLHLLRRDAGTHAHTRYWQRGERVLFACSAEHERVLSAC